MKGERTMKCWLSVLVVLVMLSGIGSAQEWDRKVSLPEEEATVGRTTVDTQAKILEDAEKVHGIDKVVVTATKTERNPDDVPASITVITKDDLRKQNIKTVDEALAQVPGAVDNRRRIYGDSMTNVNLRGFPAEGQKRTLVLLDGQNIANAYSNGVAWSSMPVENIERIEVVRGPFSALYGGNAMGGVINIITKTPKKLECVAQGGYGTYDSWTYYLGVGDRLWNKVSVQAGFNYRISAGYPSSLVTKTASTGTPATQVVGWQPTHTTTGTPTNIIGDTGDYNWNDYSMNGKISWDIAPGHKVEFSTLQSWNDYGYDMYHSYLRDTATGSSVVRGTVGLSGTNTQFKNLQEGAFLNGDGRDQTQVYNLTSDNQLTETTRIKFHGGLLNQPTNWSASPSSSNPLTTFSGGPGTSSFSPSQNWIAELQVDQAIGQKQQLVGGISYNSGWSNSKTYSVNNWRYPDAVSTLTQMSGGQDRNIGLYLQDEIAWHPKFNTVLGVRLDWWETYGGNYMASAGTPTVYLPGRSKLALSPKLAFLYRPLEWMTWRASVGRAFRAPNIYELYRTWLASSGTLYKGNPDLIPETATSWEIGTTMKPLEGMVFTATYFENYVDDLIYRVTDPADIAGKTQIYKNAGKATIRGVELEITQKLWSWLEVFGNTTLLDARINENPFNPESVGKKITYTPRQQFNFGITATYWKVKGFLSGHYVSKLISRDDNSDQYNNVYGSYDPYFTLNSKIIFTPVKYMDLSLSVDNMLDREYFYYYPSPGRTIWSQITLRF
ncbi:MAG TPA: TonB-dependent receptor [Desulfobacterales bacterium]|nr:TonB-dependent receptor [Desulfobacterales bacterium]